MAVTIQYTKGDATAPVAAGNKVIVHICNDLGGWGKGFVLAISKKWKEPEKMYREWHQQKDGFQLGAAQFVQVAADLWVANIIGQHKIKQDENGMPPIRYEAVREGLAKTAEFAASTGASVHMPRIGCGLAGGKWELIEPIIRETLLVKSIPVTVYDF